MAKKNKKSPKTKKVKKEDAPNLTKEQFELLERIKSVLEAEKVKGLVVSVKDEHYEIRRQGIIESGHISTPDHVLVDQVRRLG